MSKEKFAELMKDTRSEATPPAPSLAQMLKEVGGAIWDASKPMVNHGSHELAAALFRGDGFVMYQREGKDARSEEHTS